MRKDLLVGGGAALLLLTGLWWLSRRPQPDTKPVGAGQEVSVFTAVPYGAGSLLSANPPGPLRSMSWISLMTGGETVCYLSTQADQQLIGLYQNGALQKSLTLPQIPDVDSAFFRKASLRDAAATPTLLLLLLGDEDHPKDQGLVLALDLASGEFRWSLPASGQHLLVSGESALIFGPDAPVTRCTWAKKKPIQTTVDLPPEIHHPEALLPLGSGTFLLAHQAGLSAFLGASGWKHTAPPPAGPLSFPTGRPALVRSGRVYWWQPRPGQLFEVGSDATIRREVILKDLPAMASHELDRSLLTLLGADPEGHLWFGLSLPEPPREEIPQEIVTPSPGGSEAATTTPPAATSPAFTVEERAAWEAYLKQPMDRLYRLTSNGKTLTGYSWSERWPTLHPPEGFRPPRGDEAFVPSGGAFLLGEDRQRWRLPLTALFSADKK